MLGYCGSAIGTIYTLSPLRFALPLYALLCIAAARGVAGVGLVARLVDRMGGRALRLGISALLTLTIVAVASWKVTTDWSESASPLAVRSLKVRFPAELEEILGWLRTNTNRDGRILIEDAVHDFSSFEDLHVWFGGHIPSLLPYLLEREIIGGPTETCHLVHHFASFQSGILFGRSADTFSEETLEDYLDAYNIGWAVCWSEEAKALFRRFDRLAVSEKCVGRFEIFTMSIPRSFIIGGTGSVTASPDRIELQGAKTDGASIVLKYHWMDGLRAEPERTVEKAQVLDDPVGFIRVVDPPEEMVIVLDKKRSVSPFACGRAPR